MDGDQKFLLASLATLLLTALVTLTFAQSSGTGINQGAANSTALSLVSSFAETGLPIGAQWNVTFASTVVASTSDNITFVTSQGNLFFSIPNQVVNGTTYSPDRFAGYMVAGNSTQITFTPEVSTSTVASTSTSTVITTVSLPAVKPAQILNMSSTSGKAKGTFLLSNSKVRINTGGSFVRNLGLSLKTSGIKVNVSITNSTQAPVLYATPSDPVYQYIQINGSLSTNPNIDIDPFLSSVTYNFTVPISWIQSQGGNVSSIVLLKYSPQDQAWNPLLTSPSGSNSTAYFYSATSNSFSSYAVTYASSNTATTTAGTSLTMTGAYTTNFFAIGARAVNTGTTTPTFKAVLVRDSFNVVNVTSSSPRYQNLSIIGHNTVATGTLTLASGTTYNTVIVGVSANVIYTANTLNGAFYTINGATASATTYTLTIPVATSGSFVIVLYSEGGQAYSSYATTISGCLAVGDNKETFAEASAKVCTSVSSGTYTANILTSAAATHGTYAISAYVFPPYTVTLNDVPTTANIATNGQNQANGNTITTIGTATANAVPPVAANYIFSTWSTSNANIIISNPTTANNFMTVMGIGTVTATFTSQFAAYPNPPLVSNIVLDVGQYATLNTLLGTGNPPYVGNWFWSAPNSTTGSPGNTIIASILSGGLPNSVLTINAYSNTQLTMAFNSVNYGLTMLGTNSVYGTWSLSGYYSDINNNKITLLSNTVKINPQMFSNSFYANSLSIYPSNNQVLTANVIGGTSAYTFNYLVYNAIGSLVTNALYPNLGALTLASPVQVTSTSATTAAQDSCSTLVKAKDGYYYMFYANTASNTIYYASSPDAKTWTLESQVESTQLGGNPIGGTDNLFAVGYDSNAVYVIYDTGLWSTTGSAETVYSLTGTPSSGTITFGSPVTITTIAGYTQGGFSFVNFTSGNVFLGFEGYASSSYYNYVYNTINGGATWVKSTSWASASPGYSSGIIMKAIQGTSNMIFIYGPYSSANLAYRTYTGGIWSGSDTAFSSKTASSYQNQWTVSGVSANGAMYFARLNSASAVNVMKYTTTWSAETTVDSSSDANPSLSAIQGSQLALIYGTGSNTYARTMPFGTGTWSGATTIGINSVGATGPQGGLSSSSAVFGISATNGNVYSYAFMLPPATTSNTFTFNVLPAYGTGLFRANIILTDQATTPMSVTNTLTFTVYQAPTVSITSGPSNSVADVGQYETFTATITGGTQPYTYNWFVMNSVDSSVVYSASYTGCTLTTNTLTFATTQAMVANSLLNANVVITDAFPTTAGSVDSGTFDVNNAFASTAWTASNTAISYNQYQTLTATISGGSTNFAYNMLVYNAIGSLVTSSLSTGLSTSFNAFTFQELSAWGTGTFMANTIITDGATTNVIVTNTLTFTVSGGGGNTCTFTPNTATLGFGSIVAGANIATNIGLKITNTGNTNANILLSSTSTSGNWLYSSNSAFGFLYSNTVYSGGSGVAWATANKLIFGSASIGTPATGDSYITAPAGLTANIYLGLAVPNYQRVATYNQIITIASSC